MIHINQTSNDMPLHITSIKEKLHVLNTCLQINRGLMDPDAFAELDKAMDDILKELDNK